MAKASGPRFFKPVKAKPGAQALWPDCELRIERISSEGRGIARRKGKVVFVDGALAGETVSAHCTAVQRSFDEAKTLSIVESSAERVKPFCPLADRCGGCQLQHWDLAAQRRHKQQELFSALQKISPLVQLAPSLSGTADHYRHRLKLAVEKTAQGIALALREEGSHQPVLVDDCPVASAGVNRWLRILPSLLDSLRGLSQLVEIEIDEDGTQAVGLLCRFAKPPMDAVVQNLVGAVRTAGAVAVSIQIASGRGQWQTVYQHGYLQVRLQTPSSIMQLQYRPGDFTQTNWPLNQQMIDLALDWLAPRSEEIALDLFAGIGNFSLPLAQRVKQLHGIELSSQMVSAATANAQANGMANAGFAVMDLFVDDIVLPAADIAIIDPPRAGAESVCKSLANKSTLRRLVYISCNPATLLRDAAILHAGGLTPVKAAFIDMFPYTGHSEAMVLFGAE